MFEGFTSEVEWCLESFTYTSTLFHTITPLESGEDYLIEFDTTSLYSEEFKIVGTNKYGEQTFSPTISVEVRDSKKPVFSFPIFLDNLEMTIDLGLANSSYAYTLPSLKNDFEPEAITIDILMLDDFIEFNAEERSLTIDLQSLDPEVEELSYQVKVYNSTSSTSMTYPLNIFIEKKQEVIEEV